MADLGKDVRVRRIREPIVAPVIEPLPITTPAQEPVPVRRAD